MANSGDQERLDSVVRFILDCLAHRSDGLSERELGRLIGHGGKGRSKLKALRAAKKRTTGEVADLLISLRQQLAIEHYLPDESKTASHILSTEQIYIALHKLTLLTLEEKNQLGLPSGDSEALLEQVFLNFHNYQQPLDYSKLLELYRMSVELSEFAEGSIEENSSADTASLIKRAIRNYEKFQFGYSHQESNRELASNEEDSKAAQASFSYLKEAWKTSSNSPAERSKLFDRVDREINGILFQAGIQQLNLTNIDGEQKYKGKYLPYRFIKRLTQSVFENTIITNQFPVFLQDISVQTCGPFPLRASEEYKEGCVLSKPLLSIDKRHPNHSEIASHSSHRVTAKFYIKLNGDIDCDASKMVGCQTSKGSEGERVYFSVSSTGIGGTFSHIIKVLNFALLYDKACLREYFPIARDIIFDQGSIHNNSSSPAAAHSLVSLCKVSNLSKAMSDSCQSGQLTPYEKFAFDDPIGRGDYCAFDTLLSIASAALLARLRAIKHTTQSPKEYVQNLCSFVRYTGILKQADSCIRDYPFSSLAQESYLQYHLGEKLRKSQLDVKEDPYALFDACLLLAESFLQEGAYENAKQYLGKICAPLERLSASGIDWYDSFNSEACADSEFEVFSGTLLVRYEICKATLHYLQCEPEEAWARLDRAENHLTVRLAKYALIDEVAQATFHPHYKLSARIFFLRARLMLFFPCAIPVREKTHPCFLVTDEMFLKRRARPRQAIHLARLFLTEKARLYAACDGDSELYSCLTAYQASIYLITSYMKLPGLTITGQRKSIKKDELIEWARALRDESLLSYSEVGKQSYFRIKEKSGVSEELLPKYGECRLTPIPLIQEISVSQAKAQEGFEPGLKYPVKGDSYCSADDILRLDMSLLALDENLIRGNLDEKGEPIYLFGSSSCYLFFIRGFYHLCSNLKHEFGKDRLIQTVEEFDSKVCRAYRLFSYSWAVAADGGDIQVAEKGDIIIMRRFKPPAHLLKEKDVASIRDLYPHRVIDIAALGRLFAAACYTLRLYSTSEKSERERCKLTVKWLLSELYQNKAYPSREQANSGREQKQFNKHLHGFINPASVSLKKRLKTADVLSSCEDIIKQRDSLLCDMVSSPLPRET